MTTLAGYRRLTKRDFAFSKVAAFGLVSHQKVLLAKRPVTRRFALNGRRATHFDVSFITDAQMVARDAVDVLVTYRSALSGRRISRERHQLFADPQQAPRRQQRVWLCPPRGARFADVAFARRLRGQKVALDGMLRLSGGQPRPALENLDTILESHDLSAMSIVLSEAVVAGDRASAQRILTRMQLLSHSHSIFTELASLKDASDLETYGITAKLGGVRAVEGGGTYAYERWLSPGAADSLPLMKQVRAEALVLYDAVAGAEASALTVGPGDGMLGRLLAAALLRSVLPALEVRMNWDVFATSRQEFGPWLNYQKGASFLATQGGKTVQSALLAASQ